MTNTNNVYPIDEPLYIKVGRVWEITPGAIRMYCEEYDLIGKFGEDCVRQIISELEKAVNGKQKVCGESRKVIRMESPNLIFKRIGSKIISIRISSKYQRKHRGFGEE